jgi:hypothetical protein
MLKMFGEIVSVMHNAMTRSLIVILISLLFWGCEVLGDIFKAGFLSGIFLVVFIVGLIIALVIWFSKKRN